MTAPRCAVCGLTIKWGQERRVRTPAGGLEAVCPVCAAETGRWEEDGEARG